MPAKFKVEITISAERDLEALWDYIAEDSPRKAAGFISKLEKEAKSLVSFPERCPLIPENEMLGTRYRHLIVGKYRLVFRIEGKKVFLLRFVHGARLLEEING